MNCRIARALPLFALLALAPISLRGESRIEKTLKLDPGGRFALDTEMGSVTVTGTAAPNARLVITSKRRELDDLLRFRYREDPGSVSVTARRRGGHFLPSIEWRGAEVHFEVQVPTQTALDIHSSGGGIRIAGLRSRAKLDTSGGAIEARDLTGELEGETSGGGIELARIRGRVHVETSGGGIEGTEIDGPIHAETSGGSVRLDRVTGDIRAHSSGGGIHIHEAGGRVDADTSGGGIEATFARGNGHGGTLETSGGGIQVSLDPSVGLRIDASGNSVKADLPITVQGEMSRGKLHGNLGGGGELLRLHTSGGGVRIQGI
jgi:DUF4097 and DUF4098 domain-containing protein YvlB